MGRERREIPFIDPRAAIDNPDEPALDTGGGLCGATGPDILDKPSIFEEPEIMDETTARHEMVRREIEALREAGSEHELGGFPQTTAELLRRLDKIVSTGDVIYLHPSCINGCDCFVVLNRGRKTHFNTAFIPDYDFGYVRDQLERSGYHITFKENRSEFFGIKRKKKKRA